MIIIMLYSVHYPTSILHVFRGMEQISNEGAY